MSLKSFAPPEPVSISTVKKTETRLLNDALFKLEYNPTDVPDLKSIHVKPSNRQFEQTSKNH